MNSRNQRAEARNRTRDDPKLVINSLDKVRKWEKKWVVIKDTQIKVFKWEPITATANIPKPVIKPRSEEEQSNSVTVLENTHDSVLENGDASRTRSFSNLSDNSNLVFSEAGFDSD